MSAEQLRMAQAALGLTRQAFADELGLSRQQLWHLLTGENRITPQTDRLVSALLLLRQHGLFVPRKGAGATPPAASPIAGS